MNKLIQITPNFAVTGQLAAEDYPRLAKMGFSAVINNRPDGEEPGQFTSAGGLAAAEAAGLGYVHIPATKHDIFTDEVVGRMASVLKASNGPVVAHCKSGQRSAIAWAAAVARSEPVGPILTALKDAGLDFGFLRDELDKQADRARWAGAEHATSAEQVRPNAGSLVAA